MTEVPISVELSVAAEGPAVTAKLTFRNRSAKDVFLDPLMGCLDGKVRHKVFRIESAGKAVPYLLKMAKREATRPEDLVRLAGGGSLEIRARLDEAYGFFPGTHEYRAVYDAFHNQPGGDAPLYELVSNTATFTVRQ